MIVGYRYSDRFYFDRARKWQAGSSIRVGGKTDGGMGRGLSKRREDRLGGIVL